MGQPHKTERASGESHRRPATAVERSLSENEALLRSVGDHLPGAIYQVAVSPGGTRRFQYISAGIEHLLGVKPADILAEPLSLYSLILPEDIERVLAAEEEAWQNSSAFDCEFRQRTLSGEVRWMHCRSAPRRLPDGSTVWDGVVLDVTARKEAELELERYRLFAEHSREIVLFLRTDGRILEANAAAISAYGYTHEELLQLNILDLRDERTRWQVPQQLQDADSNGISFESWHRRKDSSVFPVDVSARGATIGTERIVLSIIRDITERKREAKAAAALAAIVESSNDAIFSKDLNGIVTSWNAAATHLYGYQPEEMIGQSILRLVPPELRYEEPRIDGLLKQGERVTQYETIRLAKDGRRLDVSLTVSPLKNERGEVIGASKIARDISAQKRSEAALRFLSEASAVLASSLNYEVTLNAVAHLSVPTLADWCTIDLVQPDGSLQRVAMAHVDEDKLEQAQEVYRLTLNNPVVYRAPEIVRSGQTELRTEISFESLTDRIENPRVLELLHSLGLRSYLAVPLKLLDRTFGVLTFLSAESGRKFGHADLALAEDLAHRAAVAIENARLYAEVSEASRRKDEFLAMLAHELRNPLAPIRNAVQLFRLAGALGPDLAHARDIIDRQVDQLSRLVDDLLDVSRFSRGKIELRKQPVSLTAMIDRALEMSRPLIEASGHTLELHECEEPLVLDADPTRVAQIIANLLNNSAKYTESRGRIWLTTTCEGPFAVIEVRDNGIGIPPEMLGRIFEPFTQVDMSVERRQGGLGIGLSLVKSLVELHGGTIAVMSPGRGSGSTFTIRLPLVPETHAAAELATSQATAPVRRGGRRILVADDNRDSADTLTMLLRLMGNDVRTVYDGPHALEMAVSYRPQIFVLDIGMPGMSGYEVARRLRSESTFNDSLLVAMTGWGQEEDRRRTKEAGFDYHLVKPVELSDLERLLAQVPHQN